MYLTDSQYDAAMDAACGDMAKVYEERERARVLADKPEPHKLIVERLLPNLDALPVSVWHAQDVQAVIQRLAALVKRNPGHVPELVALLDTTCDEIEALVEQLLIEEARA